MISRLCMVALTLGSSILSTRADQLSVTTATGDRVELDCQSPKSIQSVKNLKAPLQEVVETLRETLRTNPDQSQYAVRDQSFSPSEIMRGLRVVYEVNPPSQRKVRLTVKAYVDVNLPIEESRRARIVDAIAELAQVKPAELEGQVDLDTATCQVLR